MNHTASTNVTDFTLDKLSPTLQCGVLVTTPMSNPTQTEQLIERVERLLVRYEELQRTNALLAAQVETLTSERDSLKSRLSAARARVDALLERLPETTDNHKGAA